MNNEKLTGLLRKDDGKRIKPEVEHKMKALEWKSDMMKTMEVHTYKPLQAFQDVLSNHLTVSTTILAQQMDAFSQIVDQIMEYEARFASEPSFVSLNKKAYESLYVQAQQRDFYGTAISTTKIMNVPMVLNPKQEEPILILGSPTQELFGGSFYRED